MTSYYKKGDRMSASGCILGLPGAILGCTDEDVVAAMRSMIRYKQ